MTTRFAIIFASLLAAGHAVAHAPYEVAIGSFTRSDGVTIAAVEHYVDGILGADPMSVQFRLPDGSVVAQTAHTPDTVVVRSTPLGFEIYHFKTDWIPFASSVQRFDGFSLTDTSSGRTRLFSPFIHTRAHLREYAGVLTFAGIFVAFWLVARALPKRGWMAVMRVSGFVTITLAFGLFVLLVLFAFPVSPFVLCAMGGVAIAASFVIKKLVLYAQAA